MMIIEMAKEFLENSTLVLTYFCLVYLGLDLFQNVWQHLTMKKLTFLLILFPFQLFAENFRAPAVLDSTCNLEVDLKGKTVTEAQKEQCKAVRQCMNSAPDEQMADLKKLEAVACTINLKVDAPKVPMAEIDQTYDGKRNAKYNKDNKDIKDKPEVEIIPTSLPVLTK